MKRKGKTRTLRRSMTDRAIVYLAAALLIVLAGIFVMRTPAAEATSIATPGSIIIEYEKLQDSTQYTLPGSIYDNYKSFSDAFNEMGVEDIGGFEEIIRRLAMYIIFVSIGINLIREALKGDYSPNIFIRAFLVICVSLALIGTSGQTIRQVTGYLDDAGAEIVKNASDHAQGMPGIDTDAIVDVMFYNPLIESERQVSEASMSSGEVRAERVEQERAQERRESAMVSGEIDAATPEVLADIKAGASERELEDKYSLDILQQAQADIGMVQMVLVVPCLVASILACVQVLELKFRGIFTSLAIANVTLEGVRAPGVRYLKKYFGCYLKIFLFFAIASICAELGAKMVGADTTLQIMGVDILGANISVKGIPILLTNLIGVFMMFQSTALINEVID